MATFNALLMIYLQRNIIIIGSSVPLQLYKAFCLLSAAALVSQPATLLSFVVILSVLPESFSDTANTPSPQYSTEPAQQQIQHKDSQCLTEKDGCISAATAGYFLQMLEETKAEQERKLMLDWDVNTLTTTSYRGVRKYWYRDILFCDIVLILKKYYIDF